MSLYLKVSCTQQKGKSYVHMKIKLAYPVCGFKRLVDADSNTKSELCEESKIRKGWKPDYYAKCSKCGKQIAIKKIG